MKKEYLILLILIAGLSLYIFFRQDDQVNYTLPTLSPVTAREIDRITIARKDRKEPPIELKKVKDVWTMGERDLPVDKISATDMLDRLEQFRLLALVSESKDLARYELSPESGISVTAWTKEKKVRDLTIGKPDPSRNHTFVMLENDSLIYQANGNLQPVFEKTASDLRSKQVLSFIPSSVDILCLQTAGKTATFTAATEKNDKNEPARVWKQSSTTAPANTRTVEELVSSLSDLRCQEFLEQPKVELRKDSSPVLTISLKQGSENLSLEILSDTSPFQTVSSMNDDAFILSDYMTEQIQNQVYTLLGIEIKKEESSEDDNEESLP